MISSTCADPRISEQLLDLAQFARRRSLARAVQLSSEQAQHIEGCASCRASMERARRMVAAHQSLEPNAAEVAAARVRFAERRLSSRVFRGRVLSRAVTVGLLLALVAGAAAQIAIRRPWQQALRAASQKASKPGSHAHATSLPDSLAAQPTVEIVPLSSVREPSPAHAPSDRRVRVPRRPATVAGVDVSGTIDDAPAPAESAGPSVERLAGSWEAVAAALRAGDQATAERALDRLAALDDARTRDAARLARAQLWLAHGRLGAAREELEDLAATGATTTIRARAREALVARP